MHHSSHCSSAAGTILVDAQCAPSLTGAMTNHFRSVKMKKMQEEEEVETEGSIHQQPLVTKSCYHQDRDIKKRQNTAAKLRPKVDGRILQLTAEVRSLQLSLEITKHN